MLPETHGHQRKAFRDFVAALLVVRTCCQATLARYFPNFEAANWRLTRWLHNPRLELQAQARARHKKGHWEYWHVVSNRPLTAFTMTQEYARRFGCEEGFRDTKRELGFASARIAEIAAWTRVFALAAAVLLILTRLETELLRHSQRAQWLRQVHSRRRARTELSLLAVVRHLLDKVVSFVELRTPHTKLNLEAAL
jgi:hypothetical protein